MGATDRPVVIAGAGIAGLTLALLLARRRVPSIVLERRTRLEEIGAGIQLSPNASRVLIEAGLGPALGRKAVAPARLVIRDGRTASELSEAPLGEHARKRYGAPWWVIHRAELQAALVDAVRGTDEVTLLFGRAFVEAIEHSEGVRVDVETERGPAEAINGAALIGADGLHSALGDQLDGARPPRFSGYTAWRGVIATDLAPAPFHRLETGLWLAPDAHLVHYPVRAGVETNVVAILGDTRAHEGWSAAHPMAGPVDRFSAWAEEPRALLSRVKGWQAWSLFDRPPRRVWRRGRMALMGDAAHPMTPFLAQGGAMAIEDAAVLSRRLADALGSGDDVAVALAGYEADRRTRTTRVQAEARRNGAVYHFGGPLALARNLAIRSWRGPAMLDRLDWVYGWTPG